MSRKKDKAAAVEPASALPEKSGQEVRDAATGQFQKGHIGGPGRGKGSRNKLGEAFIQDMYEAWQTQGSKVIADVIEKDPAAFLRSMVAILPKEVDVNINKYDQMTDDQLRTQFLAALREARTLGVDIGAGDSASVH